MTRGRSGGLIIARPCLPGGDDEAAPGTGVTADKCGESLARMTMLQCYSVPLMLS